MKIVGDQGFRGLWAFKWAWQTFFRFCGLWALKWAWQTFFWFSRFVGV